MLHFQNFSIGQKLALLTGLLLTGLLLSGVLSYRTISTLGAQQEDLGQVQLVAVRNLTLADMMHDGLRAVVLSALVAAETNDAASKETCQSELREFSTNFQTSLNNVAALPLRAETNAAIAEVRPDLDAYLRQAETLTQMALNGKRAEAMRKMGEFQTSFETLEESMETLGNLIEQDAKTSVEQGAARASSAKREALLLLACCLFGGVVVSVFLTRLITQPLQQMAEIAEQLATGDVNQTITYRATDEIGQLADSFRAVIAYINDVAQAANAIGQGNLTLQITPRSDKDILSRNILQVVATMQNLIAETNALSGAAQSGNLKQRGQAEQFHGAYRELVKGINHTLEAVIQPIEETSAVLQKIAARDLSARVKGKYQGDFLSMKQAINEAAENLSEAMTQMVSAAEQVNSAANEINSGSQSLAQGASEQASSLQEVSSSLQEMSSMIKQNAANAKEARGLTEAARTSADKGVLSMQQLSDAVNRIQHSADATAKIVKTIDEIAFQTNLLALNAAVEAARAGDAGKGFAVVAEEVRNLAMRSAEAAKNTAELIEGSVKNAEGGVAINAEVMTNLAEINKQVNQVSEVMAEIAAASQQQAQGVEQIHAAIGQMNQVTQQTAANAEESAAAAQQLSGQSQEMLSLVGAFQVGQSGRRHRPSAYLSKQVAPKPVMKARSANASAATRSERFTGGENLIPFDDLDSSAALQEF